jgi:hypothetical protein
MIANAIQRGSTIQILDESGQETGWVSTSPSATLQGFCSEFLIVRDGSYIQTIGPSGSVLGSVIVNKDSPIRGITGSGFFLQAASNLLEKYSPECNHLLSQWI